MTVVITTSHTRKQFPKPNIEYWSLDKYYSEAQRCIGFFCRTIFPIKLNKDEDAISYIVEELIYAMSVWDKDRGMTLKSYLTKRSIWAIFRYLAYQQVALKLKIQSLYDCISKNNDTPMYETIADIKSKSGDDILQEQIFKQICFQLPEEFLTARQVECLRLRLYDNMTLYDIGRKLKISREAVRQRYERAITKLKDHYAEMDQEIFC